MSLLESTSVTRAQRPVRAAGIAGLGAALPERVVSNAQVGEAIGVDADWILRRTGIRERRRAAAESRLSDLATAAGQAALIDAGVAAAELDLVLVASFTQDSATPNAAPVVANDLGAVSAGAFDIGSACAGFVSALATASALIGVGDASTVLVIGAEIISRHLDPRDRKTAMLFGDGAGAVVLAADGPGAIGPFVLGADGSRSQLIVADRRTGILSMDGHETFKQALVRLPEASLSACAAAGLALGDIDLFVFHQANRRILTALIERLDLPTERVVDCIAEHGNTSAASLPLALEHARHQGLLHPGTKVLLAAVGAGFTWGATVIEWGQS